MDATYPLTRNEKPFSQYTLDELKVVGGTTTTIEVPARDWAILIAQ